MRRLITLLLLALLAAKIAATLARGPVGIELDAFGYWRLSELVCEGDLGLLGEPIAYRTPIYPYFVATIREFMGSRALLTIVAIQGVLTLATIAIAGLLAARWTKLPWAMPLTFLAALPMVSGLTFAAAVLSETLFIFLLMLNLWAVTSYVGLSTKGRAFWIGVTLALTMLTRPIVLLIWIPHTLFVSYVLFRRWRHTRRRRVRHRIEVRPTSDGTLSVVQLPETGVRHRVGHALLAIVVLGAILSPWLMRNHHLFGSPRLTEFVGRNVWIVTFQDGSGAGLELPQTESSEELQKRMADVGATENWRDTWTVSNALVASGLNDAQADRLMQQVAVEAIQKHPESFGKKAFRRIVNFWRCAATDLPPQGGKQNYRGQWTWQYDVPPIDWAIEHRWSRLVWGNTLLTGIIGAATLLLIVNSPTRPYGVWVFLILSYFAVVTGVLEIPAYRYRVVIEPLAATTIGAAAAVALSWRRKTVKVPS